MLEEESLKPRRCCRVQVLSRSSSIPESPSFNHVIRAFFAISFCSKNDQIKKNLVGAVYSKVRLYRTPTKGAITSKIKRAINIKQVLQDLHDCCSPH